MIKNKIITLFVGIGVILGIYVEKDKIYFLNNKEELTSVQMDSVINKLPLDSVFKYFPAYIGDKISDSRYLICKDIEDAEGIFKNMGLNGDELLGKKPSTHITVGAFPKINDSILIEIPMTLPYYQQKISISKYAGQLKTKQEIWAMQDKQEKEINK